MLALPHSWHCTVQPAKIPILKRLRHAFLNRDTSLGHASVSMTFNIYADVDPDAKMARLEHIRDTHIEDDNEYAQGDCDAMEAGGFELVNLNPYISHIP